MQGACQTSDSLIKPFFLKIFQKRGFSCVFSTYKSTLCKGSCSMGNENTNILIAYRIYPAVQINVQN